MEDAWKNLEAFIIDDAGQPIVGRLELTRNTDLYHDLDMNPDHIARLMKEWSLKFHVDIVGFDIHHYYPSAGLGIGSFLTTVVKSPFSKEARETLGGRALTLGMLEDAMRKGRWEV